MSYPVTYDGGEATYAEWLLAAHVAHPWAPLIVPKRFAGAPPAPLEHVTLAAAPSGDRPVVPVLHADLPGIEE